MIRVMAVIGMSLFLSQCNNSDSLNNKNIKEFDLKNIGCKDCILSSSGVFLSDQNRSHTRYVYLNAVDKSFSSSGVYVFDVEQDSFSLILDGEAGDALLASHDQNLMLFNRGANNINLRTIDLGEGLILDQQKIAGLVAYDPKEAVSIDARYMFMTMHSNGFFALYDTVDKSLEKISGNFMFQGPVLKPTNIIHSQLGDRKLLLVSHQAYQFANGGLELAGHGEVFVFAIEDEGVSPVDTNPSKEGIQGIALEGSTPELVVNGDGKLLALSICSEITINRDQCHARLEEIELETFSSHTLVDLDDKDLRMNGPTVDGVGSSIFFAAKTTTNDIYQLNYESGEVTSIYTFQENAAGYFGLYHIPDLQELWVTENLTSGEGILVRLDHSTFEAKKKHVLPLIPIGKGIMQAQ